MCLMPSFLLRSSLEKLTEELTHVLAGQIVEELSNITGISRRSVGDFAHVTLMHLVQGQVGRLASL